MASAESARIIPAICGNEQPHHYSLSVEAVKVKRSRKQTKPTRIPSKSGSGISVKRGSRKTVALAENWLTSRREKLLHSRSIVQSKKMKALGQKGPVFIRGVFLQKEFYDQKNVYLVWVTGYGDEGELHDKEALDFRTNEEGRIVGLDSDSELAIKLLSTEDPFELGDKYPRYLITFSGKKLIPDYNDPTRAFETPKTIVIRKVVPVQPDPEDSGSDTESEECVIMNDAQ
jgi:hypothetical protein